MLKSLRKYIVAAFIMLTAVFTASAQAMTVTYTELGVPNIDSSFKTWMDYRCVSNTGSPQYAYINRWGWSDWDGFMRANGEKDLGITDDYYMVAMGSYYGTEIGTKYRITTDTGNVFYAVLADCKADCDTDYTHRYSHNNDIIEFLVDSTHLDTNVQLYGSANVYMPLNGKIVSVEKITFSEV